MYVCMYAYVSRAKCSLVDRSDRTYRVRCSVILTSMIMVTIITTISTISIYTINTVIVIIVMICGTDGTTSKICKRHRRIALISSLCITSSCKLSFWALCKYNK